jgi:hypothetical protein
LRVNAIHTFTPRKFIQWLAVSLPPGLAQLPPQDHARALRRLAFAGQCGWYCEEFGQQMAAMTRASNTQVDLRAMLCRFDDCPPRYEIASLIRGRTVVERPYLALLANLTPADMQQLVRRIRGLSPERARVLLGELAEAGRVTILYDLGRHDMRWSMQINPAFPYRPAHSFPLLVGEGRVRVLSHFDNIITVDSVDRKQIFHLCDDCLQLANWISVGW